jgi:hypothetical protein
MTTFEHTFPEDASAAEHPSWCVGEAGGCTGLAHGSAMLTVPGSEISGLEAYAVLWQSKGGRDFVRLTLAPVRDNSVAFAIACDLAEGIRAWRDSDSLGAGDRPPSPIRVDDLGDSGEDDPLVHDFTMDQAEVLCQALGDLLAHARGAELAGPGGGLTMPSGTHNEITVPVDGAEVAKLLLEAAVAVAPLIYDTVEDHDDMCTVVADVVDCWLRLPETVREQYASWPHCWAFLRFADTYVEEVDRAWLADNPVGPFTLHDSITDGLCRDGWRAHVDQLQRRREADEPPNAEWLQRFASPDERR